MLLKEWERERYEILNAPRQETDPGDNDWVEPGLRVEAQTGQSGLRGTSRERLFPCSSTSESARGCDN